MTKTTTPQTEINLDVLADIIASQIKRKILLKLAKKKNAKQSELPKQTQKVEIQLQNISSS